MLDLNDAANREALARQIKLDINAYCVEKYSDELRKHLGASVIGHDCSRYIWYAFRWVFYPRFDGRMYRLFNRGHREEDRFIEWLSGIGMLVSDQTPEGTQHRISDVEGHFGGSLDSFASVCERYQIMQPIVIAEFKTHGMSSFAKLLKDGMRKSKPQHFAQMSVYGFKRQVQFGLYLAINKNDDELHVEIVKLDWLYAEDMLRKASDIIQSSKPPRRIASTPTFHTCAYCDARHVCWQTHVAETNCRSCVYAQPIANKQWFCHGYKQPIPEDFIKVGCANWQSLPVHE